MEQTWLGEELEDEVDMRELGKEEEEVIEEDAGQTGLGEELDIKLEEDKLEMRELVREEDSEYIDEEMGEDK